MSDSGDCLECGAPEVVQGSMNGIDDDKDKICQNLSARRLVNACICCLCLLAAVWPLG